VPPLHSDRGGDLWIINTLLAFCFVPAARDTHITTSSDMKPSLGTDGHTFSRSRPGTFPQATEIFYTQRKMRLFLRHIAAWSFQPELVDIRLTLDAPTEVVGIPQRKLAELR
jgi:hypothetical protein